MEERIEFWVIVYPSGTQFHFPCASEARECFNEWKAKGFRVNVILHREIFRHLTW